MAAALIRSLALLALLSGAGALPAAAQIMIAPTKDQSSTSPLTPSRTQYMRTAQHTYDAWAQKMANLQMSILQHKNPVSPEGRANVDKGWNNLKARWIDLQRASDDDWVKARTAWERADSDMKKIWDKNVD